MPQPDGTILVDTKIDQQGFTRGMRGMMDSAKAGSLAIAGFLVGAGAAFLGLSKMAEEDQQANARIRAIADSMGLFGDQAQAVTDRLIALADVQARATGVDDGIIKSTQAKLLTFAELAATADEAGGAFDRATTAAIDLAAAGFGEAETNAIQLGKALQDPIKGITALARSGVTFTEQEKEKIAALVESGDMLSAQNMILAAIETQVGGTAEATATWSDRAKVAFDETLEALGGRLLPAFESLTTWVVDKALPAIDSFIAGFDFSSIDPTILYGVAGALAGALVPALYAVAAGVWAALAPLLPFIAIGAAIGLVVNAIAQKMGGWAVMLAAVKDAWSLFTDGFKGEGDPEALSGGLRSIYDAGNRIGGVFGEISRFAVQLWANLAPLRATFAETFATLRDQAGPILERFRQIWADLQPVLTVVGAILGTVIAVAVGLVIGVVNGLLNALDGLSQVFAGVIGVISGFASAIIAIFTGDWSGVEAANQKIRDSFMVIWGGLWDTVAGFLKGFWDGVVGFFTGLYDTLVGHSIIPDMINAIVDWFKGLPGKVISAISSLASRLYTAAGQAGLRLHNGIVEKALLVIDYMRNLPSKIITALGNLGNLLRNAGTSIVQGLWDGLKARWEQVKAWVSGLGDWIADHKGPLEYDRKLLVPAGRGIIGGLHDSMQDEWVSVQALIKAMNYDLSSFAAAFSPSSALAAMTATVRGEYGRMALSAPSLATVSGGTVGNTTSNQTIIFQGTPRTYSELVHAATDVGGGMFQ